MFTKIICPLCNRKVTIFNKNRMNQILSGLSSAQKADKAKSTYPDYGKIINETVIWSLYQEYQHKYSAPVDMQKRILEVITINYPDAIVNKQIDEQILNVMQIHVSDILSLIHREPESGIAKSYKIQMSYFNDKKYWNRKV